MNDTVLSSQALMKDLSFSWPLMGILTVSEESSFQFPVFNSSYIFFRAGIMKCLPRYSFLFRDFEFKLHSSILAYSGM